MKVLITGATGYLGSRLINQFVDNGHEVMGVDINGANLDCLQNIIGKISFAYFDDEIGEKIFKFKLDTVINTACLYEREDYISMVQANYLFPLKMLNICIESGMKTWINTNSSLPIYLNKYTLLKSQFCQWGNYHSIHSKINYLDLRLENFYGAGEPDSHFISWVIKKLKNNEKLEMTDGTQKRDFVCIQDLLKIYLGICKKDIIGYKEIPIGTGEAPSIREIIEYLHMVTGSKSQLCFGSVPMRLNEPSSSCDTSIIDSLGLSCEIGWKDGMKKIIEEDMR